MGDINYLGSTVKILEKPRQTTISDKIVKTEIRAQLPQTRKNQIVYLVFWGNLARDASNYYQVNDYIMIEGYLSVSSKITKQNLKKAQITVLKLYSIK